MNNMVVANNALFFHFTASTHDQSVFNFYPDDRICNGFEEALRHYSEIVPHLRLAGSVNEILTCHLKI